MAIEGRIGVCASRNPEILFFHLPGGVTQAGHGERRQLEHYINERVGPVLKGDTPWDAMTALSRLFAVAIREEPGLEYIYVDMSCIGVAIKGLEHWPEVLQRAIALIRTLWGEELPVCLVHAIDPEARAWQQGLLEQLFDPLAPEVQEYALVR